MITILNNSDSGEALGLKMAIEDLSDALLDVKMGAILIVMDGDNTYLWKNCDQDQAKRFIGEARARLLVEGKTGEQLQADWPDK